MRHMCRPAASYGQSRRHSLVAGLVALMALDGTVQSLGDEISYHIDLARYFVTQSTEMPGLGTDSPIAVTHTGDRIRDEAIEHDSRGSLS